MILRNLVCTPACLGLRDPCRYDRGNCPFVRAPRNGRTGLSSMVHLQEEATLCAFLLMYNNSGFGRLSGLLSHVFDSSKIGPGEHECCCLEAVSALL
jgi:hypothetical protein